MVPRLLPQSTGELELEKKGGGARAPPCPHGRTKYKRMNLVEIIKNKNFFWRGLVGSWGPCAMYVYMMYGYVLLWHAASLHSTFDIR